MKNAAALITILSGISIVGCSNPHLIDCSDVLGSAFQRGTCEGEGTVVRPVDGNAEHLILSDGTYAVVELSLFPELEDGDRVFIRAKYYRGEKHVDLAEHELIRRIP